MSKIQIVGEMKDGKAIVFAEPIDRKLAENDVILVDGEYYRVIGGHRLQMVALNESDLIFGNDEYWLNYADTVDRFLMGTGRV